MVVVNTKWEDSLLPGLKYCGSCCQLLSKVNIARGVDN